MLFSSFSPRAVFIDEMAALRAGAGNASRTLFFAFSGAFIVCLKADNEVR